MDSREIIQAVERAGHRISECRSMGSLNLMLIKIDMAIGGLRMAREKIAQRIQLGITSDEAEQLAVLGEKMERGEV